MLLGFVPTIFILIFIAAMYWILMFFNKRLALLFLFGVNVSIIFLINKYILIYILGQFILMLLLYFVLRARTGRLYRQGPWILMIGLIPFNYSMGIDQTGIAWTTGAIFFAIKSYIILKEWLADKKINMLSAILSLTFIPSLPAGPVFGQKPFASINVAASPKFSTLIKIFFMIGLGGASLYVFSPYVRGMIPLSDPTAWTFLAKIYLGLLALYLDFSGYTTLALAFGLLFGVKLPENFNKPYLAVSITDFWRRWHISFSNFIKMYIYMPLVRHTGKVRFAMIVTFVLAGLWHEFSLGYLLWGLGHGVALGLVSKPPNILRKFKDIVPDIFWKIGGWALTMTWVALLSYMASSI